MNKGEKMRILVTGGAGYIGSHTLVELLTSGYEVLVLDNLSNSKTESLKRVQDITNKDICFYHIDLLDKEKVEEVFAKEKIDCVIHFAALKAVGESTEKPLDYYSNNINGTLNLLEVMKKHDVKNIIFSSSATVYGDPNEVPILENAPLSATNPYGRTKLFIEEILQDLYKSDPSWSIVILRYFNPIGAHESGLIGEDPNGIPNNLVPYVMQVAIGKLKKVGVFGLDYDTSDGSGVRDYIHVVDLAMGHVKAIEKTKKGPGIFIYNLGTGVGYSVLDLIKVVAEVSGKNIPYEVQKRRTGDISSCYANATLAKEELGWETTRNLEQMCKDAWRWQKNNPEGYSSKHE